ncbi:MAG: hypothetical protein ACHP78_15050 [Terriglobales bacterium]
MKNVNRKARLLIQAMFGNELTVEQVLQDPDKQDRITAELHAQGQQFVRECLARIRAGR